MKAVDVTKDLKTRNTKTLNKKSPNKSLRNPLQLFSISLFLLISKAQAQQTDSLPRTEDPLTQFEWRGGLYFQDGNHSAVTGGIGTELLQVYSNAISIKQKYKNRNQLSLSGGIDIITSESTDNIDFNVSSASAEDAHVYLNADFTKAFDKSETYFSFGTGGSIESDYLSIPIRIALNHSTADRSKTFYIGIESYFDDLRWGRLDEDYYRPETLIYPKELRSTEWHNEFWRYTNNLKYAFSQVIDKRSNIGISGTLSLQKGLLSTPFHRVYFRDGSARVELLPSTRLKVPFAVQYNRFLGSNDILKGILGFSFDDFGIISQNLSMEWVRYLKPDFALKLSGRVQNQSASKYFKPIEEHELDSEYYTSDYDLSKFNSFKIGAGFKWLVKQNQSKRWTFDVLEFKYSFYKRSDNLTAHILTVKTYITMKKK